MLCKKNEFKFEKVNKRKQILRKKMYNLHIYKDAENKKHNLSQGAHNLRLQVLICYVNRYFQRISIRFCYKVRV